MKSLLTYYSYSGNTHKLFAVVSDILKKKGEISVQRLKPKDEIISFFAQCNAAFLRKRAELAEGIIFEASHHDLLVIGSPVWAFAPTPAVNTFLDKINGLNGKKVLVILTSGSGAGVKKCFGNIRTVLECKGAASVSEVNVPDRKQNDTAFVVGAIEKGLAELGC